MRDASKLARGIGDRINDNRSIDAFCRDFQMTTPTIIEKTCDKDGEVWLLLDDGRTVKSSEYYGVSTSPATPTTEDRLREALRVAREALKHVAGSDIENEGDYETQRFADMETAQEALAAIDRVLGEKHD